MDYKDYYKILGLPKNATDAEIKKAYRKLAREFHPDLNPGKQSAEERFKEINEANEVLGDPEKRRKYDDLGSNWEQIQRDREYARRYARPGFESSAQDFDLGDFFETFFGERMSRFRADASMSGARRGGDLHYDIQLTLEDLYRGSHKTLNLSMNESCPDCQGQGLIMTSSFYQGKKQVVTSAKPCEACRGSGRIRSQREVRVKIPRGVREGSKIRLAGMGEKGIERGAAGDLFLTVHILPHRIYRFNEYDLEADLPIWVDEAVLGTSISVPTLNERVLLKVPPGSQTGQRLRLRGKGLPKGRGGEAGDLYYGIRVMLPAVTSAKERELFQELRRLRSQRGDAVPIRENLA